MNGRTPTRGEKHWLLLIVDLGCIVCRRELGVLTPPEVHHIDGCRKEGCHYLTIPLCPRHHRIADTISQPRWISLHGNSRRVFEQTYGTQYELLCECKALVGRHGDLVRGGYDDA